ncbi:aminoglycoside adenylyltransferase domain-containing protein [Butyrivibrio sp. INlla21]|uniref:aminoglycoside adenylyltransferase domain-containing protein n=1 Tax=Butyrivibrio sp. INlla21 TaxID=1520811 RepID=UPI0008E882C6|nr:aminoglycoside adenylyltransferase domain-containing protein [Butyrivibrio sp. INlla21]SFU49874.1 streptomycin 3-adenylyltransferase [Butyrivibrio sp. INlla21]
MDINEILTEFVNHAKDILKENLTGIYLHGSAVMGCYNPKKSDLDLIIVVNNPMTDPEKKEIMDTVVDLNEKGPAKGIEMSIVKKEVCKPFVYPTPFELHFSVMHLGWYKDNPDDYIRKMNGADSDLAAHFTIIKKRGKCLCGEPIDEVFAEVPKADYMDSIKDDIAEAEDDILDNTMYITLNLARVLAYIKEEKVLSKKEGGEWALNVIPKEYHNQIKEAMREYETGENGAYDAELAKRYAEYMLKEIG